MSVSPYSIVMAVLWSNVFIVLLYLCCRSTGFISRLGVSSVGMIAACCILRFALPIEFADTTGTIHHNSTGQTAEIFSPDGEKIASYNSNGCGWTIEHTQAEDKFLDAAAKVYMEAYHAARGVLTVENQNPLMFEPDKV